jgi:dTDP-4-dehydrorhamnose 3,5-epimerase
MRFTETPLPGAWLVDLDPVRDERGSFARTFDRDMWNERGMDPAVVQCSVSRNTRAGTLRGLHLQTAPHGETKLVRVSRGAIFDVLVDLREESPAYQRWYGVELSAANDRLLFAPRGLAHGFQTLADDTEVVYQIGAPWVPEAAAGVRWDDPAFAIDWPDSPPGGRTISDRDLAWPLLGGGGRASDASRAPRSGRPR